MLGIDAARWRKLLEADGEFRRACRQWSGSFAFDDGAEHLLAVVDRGELTSASSGEGTPAAAIVVTGPAAGWRNVFAEVPPPYYQDLLGGAVGRHGFVPAGDMASFVAYYGAIGRAAVLAGRAMRGA